MSQEVIEFSSRTIDFSRNHVATLKMENKNETHGFIFKAKTTTLNTYEVKPALGYLEPNGGIKQIEFKIVKPFVKCVL